MEYIIELLGVVDHFLEVMIFQMGIISTAIEHEELTYGTKFYQSRLRYFLQKCQYKPEYCQRLFEALKKQIDTKYSQYFKVFLTEDNLELIPILTAYTIFEWPVNRSTTFGSKKRKVEVSNIHLYNLDILCFHIYLIFVFYRIWRKMSLFF